MTVSDDKQQLLVLQAKIGELQKLILGDQDEQAQLTLKDAASNIQRYSFLQLSLSVLCACSSSSIMTYGWLM